MKIRRRVALGLSVSIFGLGYVGSVSAACFASMGHKVIGVDVSRAKVEMLDSGRTPDHRSSHERDGRRSASRWIADGDHRRHGGGT